MPTAVLVVLLAVTSLYVLQVGGAALGAAKHARRPSSASPSTWPTASVVLPVTGEAPSLDACLESLRACDYPDDRYEVVLVVSSKRDDPKSGDSSEWARSTASEEGPRIRLVTSDKTALSDASLLKHGMEAATGSVLLFLRPNCVVPSGWLRKMASHCSADTPVVMGPIAYEHNERFLPRLQALELVGRTAYDAGARGLGLPPLRTTTNVAIRRDLLSDTDETDEAIRPSDWFQSVTNNATTDDVVILDDDASVTAAPATSFDAYLIQQARRIQSGLRRPLPALVSGCCLWGTHAVLLVAAIIAVALPAWRQPTLLALLAKMGVDALLTVPVTRQLGQRGLLRSIVPTELFLVLALPLAGGLGAYRSVVGPPAPERE